MKRMRSAASILLTLIFAGCAQTARLADSEAFVPGVPGRQVPVRLRGERRTVSYKYLLYLPPDYGKDPAKKWPLVIFLHGAGERGMDLDLVKRHGPPKLIAEGKQFPFILVAPQCPLEKSVEWPMGDWWHVSDLNVLLDHIKSTYRVDPHRLYLTGLSMGGFGTWEWICREPRLFAAAVPICGGGIPIVAGRVPFTPVWAFHGGRDPIVPVDYSKQMVEAIQRGGGEAKLTIFPNAGHDSWTQAYNEPGLYDWLLSHSRKH